MKAFGNIMWTCYYTLYYENKFQFVIWFREQNQQQLLSFCNNLKTKTKNYYENIGFLIGKAIQP